MIQKFAMTIAVMLLLFTATTMAQPVASPNIREQSLSISTDQTTVLVFNAPICEGCVDRGHPDIATEMVSGMRNVLRVKARTTDMPFTNLTVITEDGSIYAFHVTFQLHPGAPIIQVQPPGGPLAQFSHARLSDAAIAQFARILEATPATRKGPRSKAAGKMRLRMTDLYLKGDVLFFKFKISNHSGMDYDVNFSRFYIRDKKRTKRTAKMEKPLTALIAQQPPADRIKAHSNGTIIVAFPKFTIADNKLLAIEIFEKNGDRPLTLHIKGNQLLNARSN